jgi:hypothetical protein
VKDTLQKRPASVEEFRQPLWPSMRLIQEAIVEVGESGRRALLCESDESGFGLTDELTPPFSRHARRFPSRGVQPVSRQMSSHHRFLATLADFPLEECSPYRGR